MPYTVSGELIYVQEGRQRFPSSVLQCPVMQHKQNFESMLLAGLMCLGRNMLYDGERWLVGISS